MSSPGYRPGITVKISGKDIQGSDIPAVVWAQKAYVADIPNEYAVIEYMVNEATVFVLMMSGIGIDPDILILPLHG